MKNLRKFVGLILLTMVVVHLAGCEITTPLAPPPQLTQEEVVLLTSHSWGGNCVARWRDGAVIEVYDETNFPLLEEVLNDWNEVLSGSIFLTTTDNPNEAEVTIVFGSLSSDGQAEIKWHNDLSFYEGRVIIDPIGGRNNLAIYKHEFGHIVGVYNHFAAGLMAAVVTSEEIDQEVKNYLKLLYSVPIGYCF